MILTPALREQILSELKAHPERALVLPDHAYNRDGFVPIHLGGLAWMLHRWLFEQLREPLNGRPIYNTSGVKGNVNPYLFSFSRVRVKRMRGLSNADKSRCPYGHRYTKANTLVFADGKRRCRTCRYGKRPSA